MNCLRFLEKLSISLLDAHNGVYAQSKEMCVFQVLINLVTISSPQLRSPLRLQNKDLN